MPAVDVQHKPLFRAVFHTLAYADVFDYPLTAGEVQRYLISARASPEEVLQALNDEERFARVGDYFTLRGREHIVQLRAHRAAIAAPLWAHALRYGGMIAMLPCVRMVAVTGSLAMNNTEQGKDIDLMLVTVPDRLWTVRAFSLLIARLARLTGVSLCPNYLVTTNALELHDRSLYVAHELAQMIPLSGMDVYREIRNANRWVDAYLPNAGDPPELPQRTAQTRLRDVFQQALELIFRLPVVSWFEAWEMDRKLARLRREQSSSSESYFSADICKGHIDRHGENLQTALALRLQGTTHRATPAVLAPAGRAREVAPTETP